MGMEVKGKDGTGDKGAYHSRLPPDNIMHTHLHRQTGEPLLGQDLVDGNIGQVG
jgi:hypothetical protein